MRIVSDLLKDLHEYDQLRRREIIATAGTKRRDEAEDKKPFHVFEGEVEERTRIALFLVNAGALEEKDDFYNAAAVIINVGSLENFYVAYGLIKKYRELGGDKPWAFKDGYYAMMSWGMTREQVEQEIEKRIGVHPRELDRE